ncbi:MAG TPA: hypothetical protein PKI19_02405 [Elusimicrobiales bacterium]|nr:hypothetical protein [Elusimicrobiales bacterium]
MLSFLTVLFAATALPAAAQVAVSTPAVTVEDIYKPLTQRDPLIPSTVYGDSMGKIKPAGSVPAVAAASFTVYGLTLTGIMEDSGGRQALLRSPATGTLYTLKGGRLIDSKKKAVPGVSGVVKGRLVVLMTEDKQVHQLSLREKE